MPHLWRSPSLSAGGVRGNIGLGSRLGQLPLRRPWWDSLKRAGLIHGAPT